MGEYHTIYVYFFLLTIVKTVLLNAFFLQNICKSSDVYVNENQISRLILFHSSLKISKSQEIVSVLSINI